jgi:hypothetical protein
MNEFIGHTWQPFHELRPPRHRDIYKAPAERALIDTSRGQHITYLKNLGYSWRRSEEVLAGSRTLIKARLPLTWNRKPPAILTLYQRQGLHSDFP